MLIDGNAIVHRAWHALPPLSTKNGQIVTSVYGFTMLLLRAIKELNPTHIAVTFDLAGPTFRHLEYTEYKAQREKKPDALYEQIPLIRQVLKSFKIPVYTAEGFEADDVIGTIATTASNKNKAKVYIVTGDMDTLQLVDQNISVFTLRKGLTDTLTYTPEVVKERYQLNPNQMVDYKALRGDPSDNIKGVKGIGEKTATQLIQQFETVENIYQELEKGDLDGVTKSVQEKLRISKDDAFLAKRLSKIKTDVELAFKFNDCAYTAPSRAQMQSIFEEFGFVKLLQQIPEQSTLLSTIPPTSPHAVNNISTVTEAQSALKKLTTAKRLAWKKICTDPSPVNPQIKSIMITQADDVYNFTNEVLKEMKEELAALLTNPKSIKITHDLKSEIEALRTLNITPANNITDLMLASYALYAGERRATLEAIMAQQKNIAAPDEKDPTAFETWLASVLPLTLSLADELLEQIKEKNLTKAYTEIDLPLSTVLADMEITGITIDQSHFAKLKTKLENDIASLTTDIYRLAGREFNINSPAQLKDVLFVDIAISSSGMKKTAKNKAISTAASELEKLKHTNPIIDHVLNYREATKILSTYVEAIPTLADPKTGRIHARFNQTVAATGRLSSSDPNLQNIPTNETEYGRAVRNGFIAKPNYTLLSADYSQFELRIIAHIAKEQSMIEAFKNNEDIHHRTSVMMFGEEKAKENRRIAKAINFGILYGMGPKKLSENANIPFAEAQAYIEQYFAMHPGITKYIDNIKKQIKDQGFVETLYGRKRFFPLYNSLAFMQKAEMERQAMNMPVQGSQADVLKLVMLELHKHIAKKYPKGEVKILIQVHDELIFEVKKDIVDDVIADLIPIMQNTVKLDVPIIVNVAHGHRWGEIEK